MKKIIFICSVFLVILCIFSFYMPKYASAEVKNGAETKEDKTTTSVVDGVEVSVHRVTCIGDGKINCTTSLSTTTKELQVAP